MHVEKFRVQSIEGYTRKSASSVITETTCADIAFMALVEGRHACDKAYNHDTTVKDRTEKAVSIRFSSARH